MKRVREVRYCCYYFSLVRTGSSHPGNYHDPDLINMFAIVLLKSDPIPNRRVAFVAQDPDPAASILSNVESRYILGKCLFKDESMSMGVYCSSTLPYAQYSTVSKHLCCSS